MTQDYKCGLSFYHPKWLQSFATSRTFIIIYGLLGTIQAMSYVYFVVTLTTIEKRFKIPTSTFGIILSGNEISQILLSLILSYLGGYRNRPRWIAWGVFFCACSCIILALPHFLYGAGEDALKLTAEYAASIYDASISNATIEEQYRVKNNLCTVNSTPKECSESDYSIVPLILIFISQFVLGIGNTLYYSLGQSYLDDNIKNKGSTPVMLSWAFSLRMLGPAVGFFVGYGSLKVYIDPTKTPTISNNDPRWMGAWWLGWIVLGIAMAFFSILIGLFPKTLPKNKTVETPSNRMEEINPLKSKLVQPLMGSSGNILELSKPKGGFGTTVKRLMKNKILMFNTFSGVFYILGSSGFITFIAKYMEVQFHRASSDATIITGPATLIGMVVGVLCSGYFISKKQPRAKYLLFWNVVVGFVYISGQFSNLFLTCPDATMPLVAGKLLNLTTDCNSNCACDTVPYRPVCNEETGQTFFSPCHAGCNKWEKGSRYFSDCSCAFPIQPREPYNKPIEETHEHFKALPTQENDYSQEENDAETFVVTTQKTPPKSTEPTTTTISSTTEEEPDDYYDEDYFTFPDQKRERRDTSQYGQMLSGACLQGCAFGFYAFTIVSAIINIFGASGRIGNLLVNYRCVTKEDKSVTQGLILMLVSLFALIPGPIIYGWIIDSTCLVWTEECGKRGTCQLYDQRNFRYYVNISAMAFTSIGTLFDVLVWWHGRDLELYEENEGQEEVKKPLKR